MTRERERVLKLLKSIFMSNAANTLLRDILILLNLKKRMLIN